MGHIVHISKPKQSRYESNNHTTKVLNLLKKEIFVNPNNYKPQIHADERGFLLSHLRLLRSSAKGRTICDLFTKPLMVSLPCTDEDI